MVTLFQANFEPTQRKLEEQKQKENAKRYKEEINKESIKVKEKEINKKECK